MVPQPQNWLWRELGKPTEWWKMEDDHGCRIRRERVIRKAGVDTFAVVGAVDAEERLVAY